MGRDLQKKKNRSGRQPVRQSQQRKKLSNPLGNDIIAKNWYVFYTSPLSCIFNREVARSSGVYRRVEGDLGTQS